MAGDIERVGIEDDTGTDETETSTDAGTDDTDADSGDGVVQPAGFTDVDAASSHAANIDAIYAAGITVSLQRWPRSRP